MNTGATIMGDRASHRIAGFFAGIAHGFWSAVFVLFAWLVWRDKDDDA